MGRETGAIGLNSGMGGKWGKGLHLTAAHKLNGRHSRSVLIVTLGGFLVLGILLAGGFIFHVHSKAGRSMSSTNDNPAQFSQAKEIPSAPPSSTSVNLKTQSTDGNSSAYLEVNGRPVSVDDPNNIRQSITSSDGSTSVNINVQNSSSSSGDSAM